MGEDCQKETHHDGFHCPDCLELILKGGEMRYLGLVILLLTFAGCQQATTTEQPAEPAGGIVEEEQEPAEQPSAEESETEESEGSGTEQKEQE